MDTRLLRKLDFKTIPIILCLMLISILVIISSTSHGEKILTANAISQLRAFTIGTVAYVFFICMDYRKLRGYSILIYLGMILLLVGLFFTNPIQHVRRWYRLPLMPFAIQPSEFAKIGFVITMSWFLEKKQLTVKRWSTAFQALGLFLVMFVLILKQPDLGTALVLYPITLGIFYFGGIRKEILITMTLLALAGLIFILLMFSNVLSHEELKPYATKVLKEYQYERLNPNTYHQKAGQTAIALGGLFGSGWCESEYTSRQWLPFAHTDSVFCVVSEEFGLFGALFVLILYFGLIYFSFQVTAVAKDTFGRLLSAGIAVLISMHVIVNIGMMCGFLPITGVPLVLMTYGGSSVLATMIALGILQSIYTRRYMF